MRSRAKRCRGVALVEAEDAALIGKCQSHARATVNVFREIGMQSDFQLPVARTTSATAMNNSSCTSRNIFAHELLR